ncbi:bifunctional methylenetetrahydrofolate dehydrogenase/methenyltetrahydrofolate cyclohydrolase FolD [Candidatus Magnetominusculus xianensis]|uniref:Bifunctional protein FolD n=2 Tax=Nitrospirota TaxID=40117 RepID=A0ABR5SDW8_9BACT|nr:bifunctional methylenetetrahydrofolate dehydrogenase/methenyltetrahydrofolate cyclohydrolase FolD [Candidatus Magnetominusculus xianensis]KWT83482.1 bifunctional 5,10-methylene-tetrahydrofolate dehydrogenase/5,10-methylene-tetrahydrofolate [Candidatus Magnetominusculus xianensis]MBF0404122.1 bifunctional methylenetetrahydrofolate dehydrogenase/methenyltetrahydrofolate cyclohydrolase FolD [Nitrospirota bacterium]
MSATIIDGKKVAKDITEALRQEVEALKAKGVVPGLAVVLVGENPASKKYVSSKEKTCESLGIKSLGNKIPENTTQEELMKLIDNLNNDPKVHGILVQLPLPKHLNEKEVMHAISAAKDVDGFGPDSLGRLVLDEPGFLPCTPHGCMKLLESYGVDPKGKHAVVVGRSVIVGKPIALLLLRQHATVTICHSRTPDLKETCLKADILCAAVGKAEMIKGDWIKEGAAVIDIGINVKEDGKLVGDVEFEKAKERAGFITPVPGGVGPMTIAMLMYNTVEAAKATVK